MSDQELLRSRLQELHHELSEVGEVDAELEPLLRDLREDIEAAMGRATPQTLGDRLGDAIDRFKASHPKLASAMGAVADQLARMGI